MTKKTILITGATAGIGKATAEALACEGHRLILTGRRADALAAVAKSLDAQTHTLVFDIRDAAATRAAIASVPAAWAEVDVLVNNAGLALDLSPFAAGDEADWDTMIDTNIRGLLTITRAILPGMLARGRGHILNLSSTAGTYQYAGGHVYGASKAFVSQLSLMLRADVLGAPVRVTNIEPGMVETDFSLVRFKGDRQRAGAVYEGLQPLTPEDVAETIRWAIAQPAHVNINRIELMPVMQAPAGLAVKRSN